MEKLLTTITLLCFSVGIYAQDSSAFDLLLDRLIKLEQRVKILEQNQITQSGNSSTNSSNTELASDVRLWRRNVKLGMTLQQIRAIYGEPISRTVSGAIEQWSYAPGGYFYSNPSITFANGRVSSHSEPR